jgi:predicted RNase H-like HicB family nuclease
MKYTVILEKESSSDWGAWVPDLPGCVAVGKTREEVSRSIQEAIEFHLEGIREDGNPIPVPSSTAIVVEIPAA